MERRTDGFSSYSVIKCTGAAGLGRGALLIAALAMTLAATREISTGHRFSALLAQLGAQVEAIEEIEAMEEIEAIEEVPVALSPQGPFDILDNVEGSHVDLVFAPIRPLVEVDNWHQVYVLNTHDSTVRHYDFTGPDTDIVAELAKGFLPKTERVDTEPILPAHVWPVPWGPVSIGYWVPPEDGRPEEVLVVCKGKPRFGSA